jgi:hypothetical protein
MLIDTTRSSLTFAAPSLLKVPGAKSAAFAVPQSPAAVRLNLPFQPCSSGRASVHFLEGSGRLEPADAVVDGNTPVTLCVDPPADPTQDDRAIAVLFAADAPEIIIELRRTRCVLETVSGKGAAATPLPNPTHGTGTRTSSGCMSSSWRSTSTTRSPSRTCKVAQPGRA